MTPAQFSLEPFTRKLITLIITLTLFSALAQTTPTNPLPSEGKFSAVVIILPLKEDGSLVGIMGSGTVISSEGYVLTNFHVVGKTEEKTNYQSAAILVTTDPRSEPEFRFVAEFVRGDAELDLAVLHITQDNRGQRISAPALRVAPIGDSDALMPDDELSVWGYPTSLSGSSITVTRGIVSGFLDEEMAGAGNRWIKTDARIAPGNSGGAAFNQNGELIGIPTRVHWLEDVPVTEGIVRPVNLALPLIQGIPGVQAGRYEASNPLDTELNTPTNPLTPATPNNPDKGKLNNRDKPRHQPLQPEPTQPLVPSNAHISPGFQPNPINWFGISGG